MVQLLHVHPSTQESPSFKESRRPLHGIPNPHSGDTYRHHSPAPRRIGAGAVHSGLSQDIGVDFTIRFGFAQNNQKKSQGVTSEHRTLQLPHVAPCNIAPSHLATFTCLTLRLKNLTFESQNSTLRITDKAMRQVPYKTAGGSYASCQCRQEWPCRSPAWR